MIVALSVFSGMIKTCPPFAVYTVSLLAVLISEL